MGVDFFISRRPVGIGHVNTEQFEPEAGLCNQLISAILVAEIAHTEPEKRLTDEQIVVKASKLARLAYENYRAMGWTHEMPKEMKEEFLNEQSKNPR